MTIDFKIEDADALGFDPARLAGIPDFFESYIAREKMSGFSILVARDGKIAMQSQRGRSAFDGGHELGMDTIFRIYSMTKPITSVANACTSSAGAKIEKLSSKSPAIAASNTDLISAFASLLPACHDFKR